MNIEELRVYSIAMELGEKVWNVVIEWDYFAKDTIGKQIVKSADSVAANISEGYGRYSYKDNLRFNYIARGSLYETKTWLTKAKNRYVISEELYNEIISIVNQTGKLLNNYIKSLDSLSNQVKENETEYLSGNDDQKMN
jgi:four helix bundle protein